MAILESRKVTKRFGGLTAVSNFDVQVEPQSIHSIIGPNGAGKTTFFNCVTGFYRHEEGTILFQGSPLEKCRRRRRSGLCPSWDCRGGLLHHVVGWHRARGILGCPGGHGGG